MYSFGNHIRRDPFGPDPMGMNMDRLQNPDPYLNQFQFAQDPNSMTPPSMGLDSAGGVAQAPYMQGMDAGGGNPAYGSGGGMNAMAAMGMANKLANSMANEEARAPAAQAGKGLGIYDPTYTYDFWSRVGDPLAEMAANKKRRTRQA